METDDSVADRYERVRLEGVRRIQDRWRYLSSTTQGLLTGSGYYSEQGRRLDTEMHFGQRSDQDVGCLEHLVGTLGLCVAAKVPYRHEVDAVIPSEALNNEVPNACEELVFFSAWRDPEFLRLALNAVAAHEQARLLTMVGPSRAKSAALGCAGVIARFAFVLASPLVLAAALVAAFERNAIGSALAFYALGACVIAAVSLQREGKGDDRTADEKAYFAWQSLRLDSIGVVGAGARFKLEQMAAEGAKVPLVAFDLCAAQHEQCFSQTRTQALR